MRIAVTSALVAAALTAPAGAQYTSNFEAPLYAGSPGGTVMTGQDGWFLPVAGSTDYNVHTYAGNSHGFVANPQGGEQFAAGRNAGTTAFARGQHLLDFSTADTWTASFDFAGLVSQGNLPAQDNLGSFSLQNSASERYFQTLYRWSTGDPAGATRYDANLFWWDAAGVQNNAVGMLPGPAWDDLLANHWYRQTVTWNFATNQILEVSITDLHTNTTSTVDSSGLGWYLFGGAAPTRPRPSAFRLFAGGNGAADNFGNTMGWDNLSLVPEPASLALLAAGLVLTLRRR